MGRLTTHVLDTALGRPAANLTVELYRLDGSDRPLAAGKTNRDGRMDRPLLEGPTFTAGVYELRFHVGEYLAGRSAGNPGFLDVVPIRFGISSSEEHYHVPLLFSPFAYSTYRGS